MNKYTSEFLINLLTPFYGPDDGGDRGDDFVPTDGDAVDDDPKDDDIVDDVKDDDVKDDDAKDDDVKDGDIKDGDIKDGDVKDGDVKDDDVKDDDVKDDDLKLDDVKPKAKKGTAKARIDRALQRARQAEARTLVLEEQAKTRDDEKTASVTELGDKVDELADQIDEIDDKIEDARADGNTKDISDLRKQRRDLNKEMRTTERAYNNQTAAERAGATGSEAVEQVRYDNSLSVLEGVSPELNPDSDQYDQDVVDDMLELKEAFESRGYSATDALARAAGYVLDGEAVVEPEVDKRKTDVKKNVKDASKQPSSLDKAGIDSDKAGAKNTTPNPKDLTEAELDALPDETRRRMRGDIV